MLIERKSISDINPAPYNPRLDLKPGDPGYEALSRSYEEFGLVEPLVWNKRSGNLVGGHQRLKVIEASGATEVEVVVVDLSDTKEKALNLALNKIQGGWDEPKLSGILSELMEAPDLDFETTGFDLDEANELITSLLEQGDDRDEDFDLDKALKAAGPIITQPSDLIELGADPNTSHRLLCGDCTDREIVRGLMNGQRATLFATDPPYLVGYDGKNRPATQTKSARSKSQNQARPNADPVTWDDPEENLELYKRFIKVAVDEAIESCAAWYCWHASRRQSMLEEAWREANTLAHCQIIWAKNRCVPGRSWYMWQHEPCLMGWLQGHPPKRTAAKKLSTVWSIDTLSNGPDRPDHPTPKPIELFEIPMLQHTRPRDVCYEPFAGSGTQFIAAERLGRRCYGLELSPRYCDVIVRRYIAFAGVDQVSPVIAERYRLPGKKEAA